MKNISKLFIAFAVIAALSVPSALALSNPDVSPAPAEATTGDEKMNTKTVILNGENIPLTESMDALVENPNINKHGFIISDLASGENKRADNAVADTQIVERAVAVESALTKVQKMTQSSAKSVNAALVNFSDTETPVLPESNVSLSNIPVWIVTFENIEIPRGGPHFTSETILADVNVVVDAYSGQVLETFSYPAN